MKRGINAWSFPAGMSQKDAMRLAAKTGYDSFELSLDAEGELSLHSSDEEIKSGAFPKEVSLHSYEARTPSDHFPVVVRLEF